MSLKKLSLSLSLFAAFGLMACGDDSSSGSSSNVISCKFTSTETSYKTVAEGGDYYVVDESSIEGASHTSISTSIVPEEELEEACSTEGDVLDMMETKCEGNKVILTIKTVLPSEDAAKALLETQKKEAEQYCNEINGKTVEELEKAFDDDEGDEGCDEACQKELENLKPTEENQGDFTLPLEK